MFLFGLAALGINEGKEKRRSISNGGVVVVVVVIHKRVTEKIKVEN